MQEKQSKGENRNCGSTSNEESGDIAVKMELMEQENEGSILNTEHNSEAASQDPNSAKDITLRNNVQIKASSQEVRQKMILLHEVHVWVEVMLCIGLCSFLLISLILLSSPELKSQVSFYGCVLSVVCPSIYPSVCLFFS